MNKLTKRILSVFLAVAMIVTILPQVATTQAATTTKKLTLYVGEKVEVYVTKTSHTSNGNCSLKIQQYRQSDNKLSPCSRSG